MRRVVPVVILLLVLTCVGAVGFRFFSGAAWLDCFYMAVITLTTVGYSEAVPLDAAGKMFVIAYLMIGIGIFTYSLLQLGQWIVELRLSPTWGKKRMQTEIDKLHGHNIVCGFGRTGRSICEYLTERGSEFVLIDREAERVGTVCTDHGWLFHAGDATDDATLLAAGIRRATSLAAALHSDADNLFLVLSARLLNPEIQIISRATDEASVAKIRRAGADRVISPFTTTGLKMARMMLHPSIEEFMEIADGQGNEVQLADILITEQSPYAEQRLEETDLRANGIMVIAIRRSDGTMLMPPTGSTVLHTGDSLFAFGTVEAVSAMIGKSA